MDQSPTMSRVRAASLKFEALSRQEQPHKVVGPQHRPLPRKMTLVGEELKGERSREELELQAREKFLKTVQLYNKEPQSASPIPRYSKRFSVSETSPRGAIQNHKDIPDKKENKVKYNRSNSENHVNGSASLFQTSPNKPLQESSLENDAHSTRTTKRPQFIDDTNLKEKKDVEEVPERGYQSLRPARTKRRNKKRVFIGTHTFRGSSQASQNLHPVVAVVMNVEEELGSNPHSSLFGIYNGYHGPSAAMFCKDTLHTTLANSTHFLDNKKQAIEETFLSIQEKYLESKGSDGSTALIALLTKSSTLFVANLGDSRAVMSVNGKAIQASTEHVTADGQLMVARYIVGCGSVLMTCRTFGTNSSACDCKPDITEFAIEHEQGQFLVLGCRILWKAMTNQEVVDFVIKAKREDKGVQEIVEDLVSEVIKKECEENVTVVVVLFD